MSILGGGDDHFEFDQGYQAGLAVTTVGQVALVKENAELRVENERLREIGIAHAIEMSALLSKQTGTALTVFDRLQEPRAEAAALRAAATKALGALGTVTDMYWAARGPCEIVNMGHRAIADLERALGKAGGG